MTDRTDIDSLSGDELRALTPEFTPSLCADCGTDWCGVSCGRFLEIDRDRRAYLRRKIESDYLSRNDGDPASVNDAMPAPYRPELTDAKARDMDWN